VEAEQTNLSPSPPSGSGCRVTSGASVLRLPPTDTAAPPPLRQTEELPSVELLTPQSASNYPAGSADRCPCQHIPGFCFQTALSISLSLSLVIPHCICQNPKTWFSSANVERFCDAIKASAERACWIVSLPLKTTTPESGVCVCVCV